VHAGIADVIALPKVVIFTEVQTAFTVRTGNCVARVRQHSGRVAMATNTPVVDAAPSESDLAARWRTVLVID
jgi:hypothetical protein